MGLCALPKSAFMYFTSFTYLAITVSLNSITSRIFAMGCAVLDFT